MDADLPPLLLVFTQLTMIACAMIACAVQYPKRDPPPRQRGEGRGAVATAAEPFGRANHSISPRSSGAGQSFHLATLFRRGGLYGIAQAASPTRCCEKHPCCKRICLPWILYYRFCRQGFTNLSCVLSRSLAPAVRHEPMALTMPNTIRGGAWTYK
jgi:hypothetical protein